MLQITVVQNILPENYDGVSSRCDTGQLNRTNGTYKMTNSYQFISLTTNENSYS
jgi:hypothetical protein